MIAFWISCVMMLGVALVIILPSFFRESTSLDVDRNKENIKIARQRLAELQADVDAGVISQSEFAATREELEQTLLGDLDDTADKGSSRSHPLWSALVTILLPLAVISLYFVVGAPDALVTPVVSVVKSKSEPGITELSEEPQTPGDAGDIESQLLVAQEYMATRRYSDAANTLETLRAKVGDHPVILVRNANALAMAANGELEGRPRELVEAALTIDPNQPQGLWLAGMAAFQRDDNRLALEYWQRLEPLMQQQDPDALTGIKKMIAQAAAKIANQETDGAINPAIEAEVSLLRVSIKLDEQLYDQVSPEDRLYVFVQSLEGPPIPLAVVSKRAKDLPLTVTLSDSMAMIPEMRLSNFEVVRVGARISKSGDAVPQSGDFQGEISPVKIADAEIVEVIISKIIP